MTPNFLATIFTIAVLLCIAVLSGCSGETTSGSGRSAGPLWADDAYEFLRTTSQSEHGFVRRHVRKVKPGDRTVVDVFTSTVFVGPDTRRAETAWLASIFVHEAEHVRLYRNGEPYTGPAAERVCLARQARYLRSIGRNYWADYVSGLDGTHEPAT